MRKAVTGTTGGGNTPLYREAYEEAIEDVENLERELEDAQEDGDVDAADTIREQITRAEGKRDHYAGQLRDAGVEIYNPDADATGVFSWHGNDINAGPTQAETTGGPPDPQIPLAYWNSLPDEHRESLRRAWANPANREEILAIARGQ